MFYTIYKITNKINGKSYIGKHKTKNLEDGYMGSGKYLNRAIEKNGKENFVKEILFVFNNAKEMNRKEAELVNEDYLTNENTYNLKLGGEGGWDHQNLNSEIQKRKSLKGIIVQKEKYKDPVWNSKRSKNISNALKNSSHKNRKVTYEEIRKALSENKNIRSAMRSLGLNGSGSFYRFKNLIDIQGIRG